MKKATRSVNALVSGGGKYTSSAPLVMNAAGLFSSWSACLVSDAAFAITPRKGQCFLVAENRGIEQMILPMLKCVSEGIPATSFLSDGLLLNLNAEDVNNRGDLATADAGLQAKRDGLRNLVLVVVRESKERRASL